MNIRIIEFQDRYAKDFADLNYEWIEKAYAIETHDSEILDSPFEYVVKKGGQIFFALVDGRPAGTVALIRVDDDTFELAKMAVAPGHRGLGLGCILMKACIKYSRDTGRSTIVLESNTKQAAAINLYRKFGFIETPLDPDTPYSRVNIRMQLAIPNTNM